MSGPQIRQYFEDFTSKYNLGKYCKIRHQVTLAEWNENAGAWHVRVQDLITGGTTAETCDILINAAGVLNKARWPEIPGLHDFGGYLVHSANWNDKIDIKDKKVGLIGNGYVMQCAA